MASGKECHPDLACFVGNRILAARLEAGLKRTDLAEMIGTKADSILFYERGRHKLSATRLIMIAHCLRKPVEFFIEGFPTERILAFEPGSE